MVAELLVKEGEVAKVGSGLCLIEVDEEDSEADKSQPLETQPPQLAQEEASTGSQPATVTTERVSKNSRWHPLDPNRPHTQASTNVLATPSVRHYARKNSVDLAMISPGSGRDGRVEKIDIDAFMSAKPLCPTTPPTLTGEDTIVELGRTRHGMWKAMVKVVSLP